MVRNLSWTTDGYALAVQMDRRWALYSPFGDLVHCDREVGTDAPDGDERPHGTLSILESSSISAASQKGAVPSGLVGPVHIRLRVVANPPVVFCFWFSRRGFLGIRV